MSISYTAYLLDIYWNNTTFKNLVIRDFIFVVDSSGKKVLFTKLEQNNRTRETTKDGNTFGSSETTYLNGNRVNKDKGENRVLNIQQLKQLSNAIEYNRVLDACLLNFRVNDDGLIPEIVAAIQSELFKT
jgi:hypothetical protein